MRMRRALRLLLPMMGLLALVQAAHAACSNPTGNAGDMTYSTSANVMAYCDSANWISMAGGVSLTVNTGGGGGTATPAGTTADVQFNNGTNLAADTGNFTYSSGLLKAPNISTTNITASGAGNFGTINSSGLGTLGSLIVTGGATITGQASITTVSTSLIQIGTGSGATCTSGLAGAQRYNTTSSTLEFCNGSNWSTLGPSGTAYILKMMSGDQNSVATGDTVLFSTVKSINGTDITASGNRITLAPGYSYMIIANLRQSGAATAVADYGIYDVTNATLVGAKGSADNGGYSDAQAVAMVTPAVATTYEVHIAGLAGSCNITSNGSSFYAIKLGGGGAGSGGTATPAGSTGDIQFNTAGALDADTGNLFWDSTNHRLGIGTGAPAAALQVSGDLIVSTTGQNSLASASLAVDSRGVSVSSVLHMGGYAISPIGAGGNVILSGTTAVSTSSAGSVSIAIGGSPRFDFTSSGISTTTSRYWGGFTSGVDYFWMGLNGSAVAADRLALGIEAADATGKVKALHFATNGIPNVHIDSSGRLLVGTTSAFDTVSYAGTQLQNGNLAALATNVGTTSAVTQVSFFNPNGRVGFIGSSGTATSYNTTSDRRMKENITDSREGLQKLMEIGVKDFSFRADPSHTVVNGFIAQDLNKVYPEAVTTNGDNGEAVLKKDDKPWSVDYGRVTPLIVKAVQDLKHLFDADHDQVVKLKAANENLAKTVSAQGAAIQTLEIEVKALKAAR